MPSVSIIVPCYNEQATIRLLLEAICRQTMPSNDLEVVIADGRSSDRTRDEIADFQQEHPELVVRLVDNPKRVIPAALNCALEAATGKYIVRLDAHSVPADDYVERCVKCLEANLGDNVGGVWEIRPQGTGLTQRAIAIAASHRLGVGDARYRYTTEAGYVDTVPFGSYRRDLFETVGFFDECLLTNEDYELNARIRQKGGRIWLDPQIRSTYFARASFGALMKQYWRYGYWKWRMLRRYPSTLRWRQALPPLFVTGLLLLLILALFWNPARICFVSILVFYGFVIFAGTFPAARKNHDLRLSAGIAAAIATMHMSWGGGFLWSLITSRAPISKT